MYEGYQSVPWGSEMSGEKLQGGESAFDRFERDGNAKREKFDLSKSRSRPLGFRFVLSCHSCRFGFRKKRCEMNACGCELRRYSTSPMR